MATSSFADRFFWARARAGVGAPHVAKMTGCQQALVFSIEKTNAKSSPKFNDKFAKLFNVDRDWLRSGEPPAPEGFDPVIARRERELGVRRNGKVVQFADFGASQPRWATQSNLTDEQRAVLLLRQMLNDFQDYAKIVGGKAARDFIDMLSSMASLVVAVSRKETERNGD